MTQSPNTRQKLLQYVDEFIELTSNMHPTDDDYVYDDDFKQMVFHDVIKMCDDVEPCELDLDSFDEDLDAYYYDHLLWEQKKCTKFQKLLMEKCYVDVMCTFAERYGNDDILEVMHNEHKPITDHAYSVVMYRLSCKFNDFVNNAYDTTKCIEQLCYELRDLIIDPTSKDIAIYKKIYELKTYITYETKHYGVLYETLIDMNKMCDGKETKICKTNQYIFASTRLERDMNCLVTSDMELILYDMEESMS